MLPKTSKAQIRLVAVTLAALLIGVIAILARGRAQTTPRQTAPPKAQPSITVPSLPDISPVFRNSAAASTKKPETSNAPAPATAGNKTAGPPAMTMDIYLDRLMLAESNGRNFAANRRSTALGPFQFIRSTFLTVARQHFAAEVAKLSDAQVLVLRTNRAFARKAAMAYTNDNAAFLAANGIKATFLNLRLAYLLGPSGAVRVLRAPQPTPLVKLLSPGVIKANPFMARMQAGDLIVRAARDISVGLAGNAALRSKPRQRPTAAKPAIAVNCNLRRPSCRRWLALQERKLKRQSSKQ